MEANKTKWADRGKRQRDVFIAEKIFGYKTEYVWENVYIFDNDPVFSLPREIVPHYTTEMSAAWLVVEKMLDKAVFTCEVGDWTNGSKYVIITFDRTPAQNEIRTIAETMPEAICLAALHVWGVEVEL